MELEQLAWPAALVGTFLGMIVLTYICTKFMDCTSGGSYAIRAAGSQTHSQVASAAKMTQRAQRMSALNKLFPGEYYKPSATRSDEQCAICIELIAPTDLVVGGRNCQHKFHRDCIMEWLVEAHSDCPKCRRIMFSDNDYETIIHAIHGPRTSASTTINPQQTAGTIAFDESEV